MSNPVEVIDRLLAQQDRRSAQILELIPDSGLSPYELARALYPELEMPHLYLGLSVATGQLEVLTEEARVIEESRDGVLHYRKAF
jgi:hypothetical protein